MAFNTKRKEPHLQISEESMFKEFYIHPNYSSKMKSKDVYILSIFQEFRGHLVMNTEVAEQ